MIFSSTGKMPVDENMDYDIEFSNLELNFSHNE